jgi:hypothetical protein
MRNGAILAMPVWEIAVALGLCFGRSRRWALAGAILMHAALVGILGPWGLGHSVIVLVWNVALACEDLVLFGWVETRATAPAEPDTRFSFVTRWIFLAAVVLPFGERVGIWDSWPSFALYTSHAERTDILVHESDLAILPVEIARHVAKEGPGDWRRLDLTAWSRAVRGVPIYPQGRASNGLGEALAARFEGEHPMVVIQWSRAGLFSGRRSHAECRGLAAIRRQADRYLLNAHPAPWTAFPTHANGPTPTPALHGP